MASTVTIYLTYPEKSRSLTESFTCADTHPSADVLTDLEKQMVTKWQDMGFTTRDLVVNIKVT